jgi:O-antigen ligase
MRVFWSVGVALNFMAMFQSGSRGALLGVGVAGFIYLLVTKRTKLIVMTVALFWAGLIIIVGGFYDPPDGSAIGRLLGQQENVAGSNQEREAQLDATLDIINDKPIFGDGFTNAILVHIVYLQFWSAGGVIAGLPVMLLGATMMFLPFGRPPRARAWPCGGAGIAVAWLFTNIFFARDQWIFIILLLRMCRWTDEEEPDPMAKEPTSEDADPTADHVPDGRNLTTRVAP